MYTLVGILLLLVVHKKYSSRGRLYSKNSVYTLFTNDPFVVLPPFCGHTIIVVEIQQEVFHD